MVVYRRQQIKWFLYLFFLRVNSGLSSTVLMFFQCSKNKMTLSSATIDTRLYHGRANICEPVILTAVTELNMRQDTFKSVKLMGSD